MTLAKSSDPVKRLGNIANLNDVAEVFRDILGCASHTESEQESLDSLILKLRRTSEVPEAEQVILTQGFVACQFRATAVSAASMVRANQKSLFLWALLGRCYFEVGAFEKSAICLSRACEIEPNLGALWTQLGAASEKQGKDGDAISQYTKAIELAPMTITAFSSLGGILANQGRFSEAAKHLNTACKLDSEDPRLLFNYANALQYLGQLDAAKVQFSAAVGIAPGMAAAHFNLGQINGQQGNHADAIVNFSETLEIDPNDDRARVQKLHHMACVHDWRWLDEYRQHNKHLGLRGTGCSPIAMLALEDYPDLLRLRSHAYAEREFGDIAPRRAAQASQRPTRLRVGYFSADFHTDLAKHQISGLLDHHDRNRFEMFAYSFGPSQQDASRSQSLKNLSQFHEMQTASNAQVTAATEDDKLDIAVDLSGYRHGNRSALFANRLAPLHMSYLGHPGTMGSAAFDYLIGDHSVCPPGSERYYCEHLLRLPHSYQINDDQRPISGRQFTRQSCGLPDDAFVFCGFNASHKITPREFDIWMRLLTQVDGSVLWLLRGKDGSQANLQREAEARGIRSDRLIFADRIPQQDHLARLKIADLFLDTFICNATTAASDALWAGLPLITLTGQQFAARVGSSLLNAVGLPELITRTEAEYEALALELATSDTLLLTLRGKLKINRRSAPLFDTRDFARTLERGYDLAFDRHLKGMTPTHLNIPPTTASGVCKPKTMRTSKAA